VAARIVVVVDTGRIGIHMSRDNLTNYIIILVSTVWAIVAVAGLAIKDYTALIAVSPVMMAIVGFLVGAKGFGKSDSDSSKES
jgi:hypothetical protein